MSDIKKILIIEDDVDMVESMKIILESKRYKVFTSYSPDVGFEVAKQEKPDLILLDVMFGSKGEAKGFDYAVKMKTDKTLASIPILMITAINAQYPEFKFSPETDGEYLPVDEFINKPVQPEDLINKVEKLLTQGISKWAKWPDKDEVSI